MAAAKVQSKAAAPAAAPAQAAAASSSSSSSSAAGVASATEFGTADYIIKVVVIGDSGVGKSCLLKRFASGSYLNDFYTTIGVDLEIKTVDLNGKLCKLQIWDTAGQERFRNITTAYYRGAHAIMLCYDVTSATSFASIPHWLREIARYASDDAKVLLVGNKTDLNANRVVSTADGAKLAADLGLRFLETSAKSCTNVEAAFMAMAQDYVDAKFASLKAAKGKGGSANGSTGTVLGGAESVADPNGCNTSGPLTCPTCTIL